MDEKELWNHISRNANISAELLRDVDRASQALSQLGFPVHSEYRVAHPFDGKIADLPLDRPTLEMSGNAWAVSVTPRKP